MAALLPRQGVKRTAAQDRRVLTLRFARFSAVHAEAEARDGIADGPPPTQAVWKLILGDRDEILNHEVCLHRNNDSSKVPSGFNYCAEGLGTGVFTQPGPISDVDAKRGVSTKPDYGRFACQIWKAYSLDSDIGWS